MLFLHGLGDTAHIFDDLAPKFTNQFRVLGLSRRGHGQSEKLETGYDTATLVEDIRQFLDALRIERVILVGHSLGRGRVDKVRRRALRPCHQAYLSGCRNGPRASVGTLELYQQLSPELSSTGTDKESLDSFRRWVSRMSFWSEAWEANLREMTVFSPFSPDGKILRWAMPDKVSILLMQGTQDSHPDYSKIRSPALNIAAVGFSSKVSDVVKALPDPARTSAEDSVRRVTQFQREEIERFRKHIPNGRVIEVPNTDHHCFIQRENEVVREMREFLAH